MSLTADSSLLLTSQSVGTKCNKELEQKAFLAISSAKNQLQDTLWPLLWLKN